MNKYFLLILTILVFSCQNHNSSFNSEKWREKGADWTISDIRENMVQDLIDSDTLKGLTKLEVIKLLGEPDHKSDDKFTYLIKEYYKLDIDPVYSKYLSIKFKNEDTCTNYQIWNSNDQNLKE